MKVVQLRATDRPDRARGDPDDRRQPVVARPLRDLALATDLYELTMGAAYAALHMEGVATFSLFVRKLPAHRAFLVVDGIEEALRRLESICFDEPSLDYLRSLPDVSDDFVDVLRGTRFQGDVWAMRDGSIVFADEPILEVTAPILQAQLVETLVLNAVHFPTAVATKAARCVAAARGRSLVDFGLRRDPGVEAGLAVARSCYLVGFSATSNVLAGREHGIPVAGTVAHSFIELFPSELEAFRAFSANCPGPVTLLVDTYDTLRGVDHAITVARELAECGRTVAAIRLDSGDLDALSRAARRALDAAGLERVRIFASGGLDEYAIDRLARAGAPIDGFGVGTRVGMSADAPVLDMAYKLVDYQGRPCLKLSEGKESLVGRKQVFRERGADGRFRRDRIAARDESSPAGEWVPLLAPVMLAGRTVVRHALDELRELHAAEVSQLPSELLELEPSAPYPLERSRVLDQRQRSAVAEVRRREGLRV